MWVRIRFEHSQMSLMTVNNTVESAFGEVLEYVNSRNPILAESEGEMISIVVSPVVSTSFPFE